jgi:polar amino acid transport system substrate-binding protein
MIRAVTQLVIFLNLSFPALAQDTLVLSAVENAPSINTVGQVLQHAYRRLGINVTIRELPGLRGLQYSNRGITDGEAFRNSGIENEYPNLIRIDIPVRIDAMHLYVKQEKAFIVEGWDSIPKGYRLGYLRGVKFVEYAILKHGLFGHAVGSADQLFLQLKSDRNDVVVAGVEVGARLMSEHQVADIVRLEPPIHTAYLYHYLHSKHADLVPKITAVLKTMAAIGEIQTIREQAEVEINLY